MVFEDWEEDIEEEETFESFEEARQAYENNGTKSIKIMNISMQK